MRVVSIAAAALLLAMTAAGAQTQSTSPSKPGCDAAAATPATPETRGDASGTAPGNGGSTGFSGAGLGGAYTGTAPSGAVPGSPSVQPATAKGLDPIAGPRTPVAATAAPAC